MLHVNRLSRGSGHVVQNRFAKSLLIHTLALRPCVFAHLRLYNVRAQRIKSGCTKPIGAKYSNEHG